MRRESRFSPRIYNWFAAYGRTTVVAVCFDPVMQEMLRRWGTWSIIILVVASNQAEGEREVHVVAPLHLPRLLLHLVPPHLLPRPPTLLMKWSLPLQI